MTARATRIETQARMEMLARRYEKAAALGTDSNETESEDAVPVDRGGRSPAISLGRLIDLTG